MSTSVPPLAEMQQKNLEAAMALTRLSMASSQRMIELQADLARQLFEDGVAQTRAQLGVKDPQQLLGMRSQYAQATAQHMIEAGLKLTELGNEARAEFARLLGEQLASGGQEMAQSLQSAMQGLPGGAGPMAEVMKTAMTNAQSALAQMTQVSQTLMGTLTGAANRKK
ncbi:hypothetical protein B9N43_07035 [Denitratisoma sp. DHT3]|uniref:phasin family protein n=1 Tax=Denitratisoma sp. DHT3 TaxID=1981880 RepID=UPI001198A311|nr:phasin family protein [Denitratisoma sp. DHT3]QDX81023.1 hypothetical protein B9N43_07035 [Denitratisoma sp. DHT3]